MNAKRQPPASSKRWSTSSPAAGCNTSARPRGHATRRSSQHSPATSACAAGRMSTSAAAGFFALGAAKAIASSGRDHMHIGDRRRKPAARCDRGPSGRRAADHAHRRPPSRATRGRCRADDRPAQAVRRRGQVVLRARVWRMRAKRDCGGSARSRAARTGRPAAPAPGRCISTFRCANRSLCASFRPRPGGGGRPGGKPWLTIDRPRYDPATPRRHEFGHVALVAGSWEATQSWGPGWPRSRRGPRFRCWPTRCRGPGGARRQSPTTTCSCATASPPPR